jgi:hypothetical protein
MGCFIHCPLLHSPSPCHHQSCDWCINYSSFVLRVSLRGVLDDVLLSPVAALPFAVAVPVDPDSMAQVEVAGVPVEVGPAEAREIALKIHPNPISAALSYDLCQRYRGSCGTRHRFAIRLLARAEFAPVASYHLNHLILSNHSNHYSAEASQAVAAS